MGDLEHVAEQVADHRPSIPIRRVKRHFEHLGASIDRSPERLLSIVDVDVEERREALTLADRRDHDDGVTDAHFCWSVRLDVTSRPEHVPEERDLCSHIRHDEARSHRSIARTRLS